MTDQHADDLTARRATRDQIAQHRQNAATALRTAAAELRRIHNLTPTQGNRKEAR